MIHEEYGGFVAAVLDKRCITVVVVVVKVETPNNVEAEDANELERWVRSTIKSDDKFIIIMSRLKVRVALIFLTSQSVFNLECAE